MQHDWSHLAAPARSSRGDARERMPAFFADHVSFFVLLAVLMAQVLLLSFQITRNHNVRLIHLWAIEVFSPFDRALGGLTSDVRTAWNKYSKLRNAEDANTLLAAEVAQLRLRTAQLKEDAAELQQLRTLLDYKSKVPLKTIAAEIIASGPAPDSRSVIINRGSSDGLRESMAVLTPQGIVGQIIAAYPHTAQVLLITDPTSGAGCMLANTRTQGVLQGTGQTYCRLKYVMSGDQVTAGEAVLTSGLDQIYPKGLPVGNVVSASHGSIYEKILVKPAAPLDRLENVLVVLDPFPAQSRHETKRGRR